MLKALLLLVVFTPLSGVEAPQIRYLTWQGNPSTTMTIIWHSSGEEGSKDIFFKRDDASKWTQKRGTFERIAGSNIAVHQVELTGLRPDSLYQFRFERGKVYTFRTMPDGLTRPLRVVIGGDVYFHRDLNVKMNREVASRRPDFVILGGDIAYTEGLRLALKSRAWKINRWQEFFLMWSSDMVTPEGRCIPIVPVIGNHDVREGFDNPFTREVLFYQFFVFEQPGIPFRMMHIGQELIFYLLDSGHTFPIGGRQTEWLKGALQKGQGAKYRIPVYHIPAYPSETHYTHRGSMDIRKHWVPLFEAYGVAACMEHDCHAFKRTFPLRKGMVDMKGVYYLGDGAWGVSADKPFRRWYLAKALQTSNYWELVIDREKIDCIARDNEGNLIDELRLLPDLGQHQLGTGGEHACDAKTAH